MASPEWDDLIDLIVDIVKWLALAALAGAMVYAFT
jgi:hypothetical protein